MLSVLLTNFFFTFCFFIISKSIKSDRCKKKLLRIITIKDITGKIYLR